MRTTSPLIMALAAVGFAIAFGLSSNRASAAEPEIHVEADASEIYIGESVDYVVEIRNVKRPSAPDLTAIKRDFDVASLGDESRNQSSTYIFNGRITQQSVLSHAYRYRLTPKRTGKLSIPAPTTSADGQTIQGQSLPLNVIAPEAQDLVVAEIASSRARVYPTQPFEITLRIFVRPLPDDSDRDPVSLLRRNSPHLDVNWVELPSGLSGDDKSRWLQKLVAESGSGGFTLNDVTTRSNSFFEGPRLAVFNLFKGRETRKGLDGQPINYFEYELKREITAEKADMYTFGPAVVKGSFVDSLEDGKYLAKRLVAVANKVVIEVRDVPTPRPPLFCGGIGDYRLAASASPAALRVGDPLTLRLDVERTASSGSLDMVSAPDLSANSELAANFEILDKNPTGRKEGDTKRFEYALRPKRAGISIPALAVTVFSPETEKFREVTTAPIALEVSAGSKLEAAELVGSLNAPATPEIKTKAQGIFQNITDPSELSDQRVNLVALASVAAGLWVGMGVLMAVISLNRRKSGDVVWRRRRNARHFAEKRLAEAKNAVADGQSTEALRGIRSAITGLIADMRLLVAEGLTAADADHALACANVAPDDRAAVGRLLEAVESAEYGSGTAVDVDSMIETARRLIPTLARQLERSA